MGGMSWIHWVLLLTILIVLIYPIARILKRIGWNQWLAILWLIPLLNIVMLWVVAFAPWPALQDEQTGRS
jgi:hypothetical protein